MTLVAAGSALGMLSIMGGGVSGVGDQEWGSNDGSQVMGSMAGRTGREWVQIVTWCTVDGGVLELGGLRTSF